MSRDASLIRDFAGEPRSFRLGLAQWAKIDEACGFGPVGAVVLFKRTALALEAVAGNALGPLIHLDHKALARPHDVRTVVLHGLIGGGMKPADAEILVRTHVDDRPVSEPLDLAYALAMATLVEVEGDRLGESAGEAANGEAP